MINIGKSLAKRVKNKEAFWMFRAQLKQLYLDFEAQVEALCQQTGVTLEEWYSPSYIPQPKFVFNSITLDADMLYDEGEFHLLFAPKIPWRTRARKLRDLSIYTLVIQIFATLCFFSVGILTGAWFTIILNSFNIGYGGVTAY